MANSPAKTKKAKTESPGFHIIQKVIKGDTYLVLADSQTHVEDAFTNFYASASLTSNVVLKPPYDPETLAGLVTHNNILNQCIEAMEVNIDSTGHTFESVEEDKEVDKAEEKRLKDFFNEPYPGQSFVQMRRKLRRDMESIGYAPLEVLTNLAGEVVGLRNMDTYNLRFVKLDEPVQVDKTVTRDGKEVKISMMDRERRFMQRLGNKYFYYREFGSTREVNRDTGEWETEGKPVPPEKRGSQLIMFTVLPDIRTPYGIPRWINNLPSVVGSRKAEEQNLEFFDAGGMPPAIIFVQGGTLAGSAAEQLRMYLSGKNQNKNRAVVVEAQSSSGSLESAGAVKVSVERFGADQAKDSMFSTYDTNMEDHVRTSFRLPAMFLGRTDNYNYATAVVAYMVAEEQVFQPERTCFDEMINKTVMRALGAKTCKFQSKGITLKNADAQLKALEIAQPSSEGKGFMEEVNKIAGTNLVYQKPELPPAPAGSPAQPKAKPALSVVKSAQEAHSLIDLALKYGNAQGLFPNQFQLSAEERQEVLKQVKELAGPDLEAFNALVASYAFNSQDGDLVGLVGCAHGH